MSVSLIPWVRKCWTCPRIASSRFEEPQTSVTQEAEVSSQRQVRASTHDHTHNRKLRGVPGRPYHAEPFVSENCTARRNLDGGDASAEDHDEPVPMCAMERASVFCQSGKDVIDNLIIDRIRLLEGDVDLVTAHQTKA
jgi:hypothetical protein